jgi:fructose-bisphosphate aldolase class I
MNEQLEKLVQSLTAPGKGLLAIDESNKVCEEKFAAVNVECTEFSRQEYRQLLLTAPGIESVLSGVIFYEETYNQITNRGQLFRDFLISRNIYPGIKVDKGLIDLPGFENEKISQGLDGLPERMADFAPSGAKFAKWRAEVKIDKELPTTEAMIANAFVLARFARIAQDVGIVPVVELEVTREGKYNMEICEQALSHAYSHLFQAMKALRVHLPGAILKTNMVLPGKDSGITINHDSVSKRTVKNLHEHVPHELGGVVFVSGNQSPSDAFVNLNRIIRLGPHPWGMTFAYSSAFQNPVIKAWAVNRNDVQTPQSIFLRLLNFASAATKGILNEQQVMEEHYVLHPGQ